MRLNQESLRGASPDSTITDAVTSCPPEIKKEMNDKAEDKMIYGFMMSSIWGAFFSIFMPTEEEQ
jgi:hypothetical protein